MVVVVLVVVMPLGLVAPFDSRPQPFQMKRSFTPNRMVLDRQ